MAFRIYNTLGRKKDDLKPINKDWVGLYTCGPTVYHYAHIGNLRTYIFEDILERALEYNGFNVKRVMNITDVGHLTGDSDVGDDKMEKAAQAERKSPAEIAKFYTDAFFKDLEKLNIKKPEVIAPATQYIADQIELIKTLFEKGHAYDTPEAVYFDVSTFKDYGKLSGQKLEEKSIGAREEVVAGKAKRNAADFALWFKLEGKFKNHLLHWPSPWGEGFPGWHIECSAISRHFLGQPFDIHTGGVDHIGTHHTNEIAQSEAAFGVPLAHIWMHGEHLVINEAKMAKSEGNFLTLSELEARGYKPMVYRYLVLMAHYRTPLNFTWESLEAAKNGINNLYKAVNDHYVRAYPVYIKNAFVTRHDKSLLTQYENDFNKAISDDLNTSQALEVIHVMLSDLNDPKEKIELVKKFDKVLGLRLDIPMENDLNERKKAYEKLSEYDESRTNKQFKHSDDLREEIKDLGYEVRTPKQGKSYIVKKSFF